MVMVMLMLILDSSHCVIPRAECDFSSAYVCHQPQEAKSTWINDDDNNNANKDDNNDDNKDENNDDNIDDNNDDNNDDSNVDNKDENKDDNIDDNNNDNKYENNDDNNDDGNDDNGDDNNSDDDDKVTPMVIAQGLGCSTTANVEVLGRRTWTKSLTAIVLLWLLSLLSAAESWIFGCSVQGL